MRAMKTKKQNADPSGLSTPDPAKAKARDAVYFSRIIAARRKGHRGRASDTPRRGPIGPRCRRLVDSSAPHSIRRGRPRSSASARPPSTEQKAARESEPELVTSFFTGSSFFTGFKRLLRERALRAALRAPSSRIAHADRQGRSDESSWGVCTGQRRVMGTGHV
jgi:hypothetical protein